MSHKKIFKYKYLVLLYIFYIVLWVIIISIMRLIFREDFPIALSRFVPFDSVFNELAFLFIIIIPVSSIIGFVLGGYFLTPVVIYIHKKIFGKKMFYGIHYQPSIDKIKLFSKAIFPAFMAINLSTLFLTPEIVSFLLDATLVTEFETIMKVGVLVRLLSESVLLMFTFGLALGLFSIVWFLEDSGIIYSNKKSINSLERAEEPFTLKSMGDWFQTIFKSYAGLGAIISYVLIIYEFLTNFIKNLGIPGNLLNIPSLVLWLGLPFYLVLAAIPCLILNDLIRNHRIKYIRKIADKFKIRDPALISFQLKKET
ncbi:MAG: hypothetical protein ACFE85_06900 [Candidatus Hodarchaeota archaeon]